MLFPKKDAIQFVVDSHEKAIEMASSRRKQGGCFEAYHNLFIVYWLTTTHPLVNEFAW